MKFECGKRKREVECTCFEKGPEKRKKRKRIGGEYCGGNVKAGRQKRKRLF